MQVVTPPLPAGDDAAERVVLRDGSVATLRPSRAGDAAAALAAWMLVMIGLVRELLRRS